jgi:ribosome recycling factor
MPTTQTKAQLLNQVEVLKYQNSSQLEEIASLRRVNKELQQQNWNKADANANLRDAINQTRAEFEAYKTGARTFQQLAERQIIEEAAVATDLKLKLLNATTAIVFGEAKKEFGV